MAKQVINVGVLTNDGTGDTLRVGAQKINENFTELYTFLSNSGGQLSIVNSVAAGDGITVSSLSGNILLTNKTATRTAIGGVKVGDTLTLEEGGVINYDLPTASPTIAGAVKIDGVTITMDVDGVISAEAAPSTPEQLGNGIYSVVLEPSGQLSIPGLITAESTAAVSLNSDVYAQMYWCPDVADTNFFDPVDGGPTFSWVYVDATGAHVSVVDTEALTPYQHNWMFSTTGNLYLPVGGDILDNNGNSVLGGNYTLPTATGSVLGGVKVGAGLSVAVDGTLSVNLTGYATESYVNSRGFITNSALSSYATQMYVNSQGFATQGYVQSYVPSYVNSQGFATQGYVNGQGFVTSGALSGYATQSYVTSQGYITSASLPNVFSSVAVSGQSTVNADSTSDTLTLVAGTGITITTDSMLDTITINSTGGGGASYDQSLNTTDNVAFVSVTADTFASTSAGTPTLTSATNINLTAANAVVVTTSPFRLANLTTTQRNALTAVNGDMIYNTTVNKLQGYQNGAWINLDGTV